MATDHTFAELKLRSRQISASRLLHIDSTIKILIIRNQQWCRD